MVSFTGAHAHIREIRRKLQRGLLKANVTLTVSDEKKSEAMFTETLHVDEDAIVVPVGVKIEIAEDSVPIYLWLLAAHTRFSGEEKPLARTSLDRASSAH